ncbi:MAG: hypothetical protein WDW38_006136 [Sanguina aurantia]
MTRYALLGSLCLLGLGACQASTSPPIADLSAPASAAQLTLAHVQRTGDAEHAADGIAQQRYAFQPGGQPQITIAPAGGAAWNWTGSGELRLRVQNGMPWAVTLDVDIDSAGGKNLHATVGVPAGPAQTLVVPLHAASPRGQGMQVGPPMPFDDAGRPVLLATTVSGTLAIQHVSAIRLGMPTPQAAQTLLLGAVETAVGEPTVRAAYAGIVDQYGQSTRGHWPEKVSDDAALHAAHAAGQAAIAGNNAQPAGTDRYGGRLDVHGLTATGWFHTQKANDRWQLVTPEGHAFFSLGVNAVVADGDRSYVEGREFMVRDLPPASGAWAAFYGKDDSRRPDQGAPARASVTTTAAGSISMPPISIG